MQEELTHRDRAGGRVAHVLLLILILAAFGRVAWRLETKNLWWDESLTLQRAESSWPALLLGKIVLTDGQYSAPTTDQHPFLFFALEKPWIALAGKSEYALRFPAAMAAVLLVPLGWTLARRLARRRILPPAAPAWTALLCTVNPFYLWYGQEARAYTLLPLLALLSTYLLVRWADSPEKAGQRKYLALYGLSLVLMLSTHYLAALLLPVHAAYAILSLWRRWRRAAVVVGGFAALGVMQAAVAAALIAAGPVQGTNFTGISLRVLLPDLTNAFSLGLSVDLADVRWIDYGFAALALGGLAWSLRAARRGDWTHWLLPALLVVPVVGLEALQRLHPAYMNARHMSFLSGFYLLLVAGGLAWAWQWRRWVGALLGAGLVVASGYSTVSYFTMPRYDKDHFAEAGAYLREHLLPGDAVVAVPSEMRRLYEYYLPLDELTAARQAGAWTSWQTFPLYNVETVAMMNERFALLTGQYRRIWLVSSGMVPLNPARGPANKWLPEHTLQVRERGFLANTNLKVRLFLPQQPELDALPESVQHRLEAGFGDKIHLAGYEVGRPLLPGGAIPVTFYWQTSGPIDRHYKYVLRLESATGDQAAVLATDEREPFEGAVPTTHWQPGKIIREYTELSRPGSGLPVAPGDPAAALRLSLQVYDAETLAKLPVTAGGQGQARVDGESLILPYVP